jgi:hypothetical protein
MSNHRHTPTLGAGRPDPNRLHACHPNCPCLTMLNPSGSVMAPIYFGFNVDSVFDLTGNSTTEATHAEMFDLIDMGVPLDYDSAPRATNPPVDRSSASDWDQVNKVSGIDPDKMDLVDFGVMLQVSGTGEMTLEQVRVPVTSHPASSARATASASSPAVEKFAVPKKSGQSIVARASAQAAMQSTSIQTRRQQRQGKKKTTKKSSPPPAGDAGRLIRFG